MKRLFSLLFAAVMILTCLTGCAKRENVETDKLKVLGTVFPPYDFAREIGADLISADMLMSPGTDSHSYSGDNPSDILKIANCDLFIYVGGESEEAWIAKVLSTIKNAYGKAPETLKLSDYADLLEESSKGVLQGSSGSISFSDHHGHHHENGSDHESCAFDEHIWTSLSNAEKMAEAICRKLCKLDEENSDAYEANFQKYSKKLRALDESFKALFDTKDKKPFIFADRFPFAYFSKSYGLECYAAFGGCATENEPSPTTIASLIKIISERNVNSIFYIETSKSTIPAVLCRATDSEAYLIHSCHTVTAKQLNDGVTYLSLMEQNLENFRKALSNDR